MDHDTARSIRGYIQSGVVVGVVWSAAVDACDACFAMDRRVFPLHQRIPEIPHPGCTSKKGCRCCYAPVVDERPWGGA